MEKPQIAFQVMECQEEKVSMYTQLYHLYTGLKSTQDCLARSEGKKISVKNSVNHIALCN